ncbi:MAG: hypothetical protein E7173_00620 [Firmicutes bacterium]|nr:hypothetical protein [Bacillota bacterium]
MKKISKYKINGELLFCIISFFLISVLSIYSAQNLLPSYMNNLVLKQIMWYGIGFLTIFFIMYIGNEYIYKHIWILYIIGILSLIGLLIFAEPINEAKCWFTIPGIGAFQPSEFMKIILIITLGSLIQKFHEKDPNPSIKQEFLFLFKVMIVVLIPSLLTFLQPDTGVVLIYLLTTLTMLFVSGIRYRWFIICFSLAFILIGGILIIYFLNEELFVKIFGTSFFLRIDRILDWSSASGYQLEHGMASIGSGGILGLGFTNTPIYFPEPQTDFIFAVYSNNTGFLGSIILLILIAYFDIKLIFLAIKTNSNRNKYIISGIVGMLIYQQFQNIGMTIGLMPITGITLPFISYGGSSLISYMIMLGIVFNISNELIRFTN